MSAIEVRARPWRTLEESDRSAYRMVVAACPYSTVFHTVEWLDVLEESFGPVSRCLLAYAGGRLVGGFPFFMMPGPWPGRTSHSCLRDHEMVYGGPVSVPDLPPTVDAHDVLDALLDRFESGPRTLVSFVLPPHDFPGGLLDARGYRRSPHQTALIDLSQAREDLWAGVHPKTRNMISKARRAGVRVREARADDLAALPGMIAAPFDRAGRRPPPRRFILQVARHLGGSGQARVLVAVDSDGRPVAGSIFLLHRRRSYYWAGGALEAGYESAASHLVQWEGIEVARAAGCREHDLVMVDPVAAPGIARFKLRFGGRPTPLYTAARRRLLGRVMGRIQRFGQRRSVAAPPESGR